MNVIMLTILNELSKVQDEQTGTFVFDALNIVYIAPISNGTPATLSSRD